MKQTLNTAETDSVSTREIIPNNKLLRWGKMLTKFISVQIFVQAVGLLSGIFLIRKLSQTEYAFFTIANSMQATLIMLADVGLMNALSASGGRVWQDPIRFGQLIKTGLLLRRKLAISGVVIVAPILYLMIVNRGGNWLSAISLVVFVLVGVGFRVTNDILAVIPKMNKHIDRLQKLDLSSSSIRFAIVLIGCATFINASISVLASSISYTANWFLLKKWALDGADLKQPPNPEDNKAIWQVIRQQAPNTVYYCIQGQLVVFIISIFGKTRSIAEVGALGRLSMFFALVTSVMTSIIVPRFACCHEKKRLVNIYKLTIIVFTSLSVLMMLVALFLPSAFLWLLGMKYAYLQRELSYAAFSTVVYAFGGAIYSLNASRAWTKWAWISIPITIIGQIALAPLLNLSSVRDVIFLNTLPAMLGITPYAVESYISFKKMQ